MGTDSSKKGAETLAGAPQVSVVVCTRNRAQQLAKALEYWRLVDATHLAELVLVDNGSTDSTRAIVQEFSQNAPFPVSYCFESRPGLSRARNTGIKNSRGDVLVFTDDDCYPRADFISEVWDLFQLHPELGYIGGRVLLHDEDDLRITVQERESTIEIPPCTVVIAGLIHGANLSVRRSVISKIKYFDERLGAGAYLSSAEDTDLIARASWNGFKGMYHPGPVVYHHHGRKLQEEFTKLRKGYAIGRGAYYIKFILRPQSFMKYTEFWVDRFKRDRNKARLYELRGALTMLFLMIMRKKKF